LKQYTGSVECALRSRLRATARSAQCRKDLNRRINWSII